MKKGLQFLVAILIVLVTHYSNAQEAPDFFVDDWKVLVKGTPNGDAEMIFYIERTDGKLGGEVRSDMGDPIKIDKIDETENSITVYYFAAGYDIRTNLKKVDDNNLKGSLLDMFETTAVRVVEDGD